MKQILHTITKDTAEECQVEVDGLFVQFHPIGYGTKLISQGQNQRGQFTAIVTRYDSCD